MEVFERNVKTTFLILSDTHGIDPENENLPFSNHSLTADILLHCGDLTESGRLEEHENALRMLEHIDAKLKLVIAGNHDLSLDKTFWKSHGGDKGEHNDVVNLWTSNRAAQGGIHLLDEGLHRFSLENGAELTLYASPYTPQYGESAFQYPSRQDRFNPQTPPLKSSPTASSDHIPDFPGVEIIMTHGPPKYRLDLCDGANVGCEHLMRALCRAKPLLHCFGHVHNQWGGQVLFWEDDAEKTNDYGLREHVPKLWKGKNEMRKKGCAHHDLSSTGMGLVRGEATCVVNASIMDAEDEPRNYPWLLELDLPRKA